MYESSGSTSSDSVSVSISVSVSTNRLHSLHGSPPIDGHRRFNRKRWGYRKIFPLQDPKSPYYLTAGDHPGTLMVYEKLTGENNYITWENGMTLGLVARRKLAFINGGMQMPSNLLSTECNNWETINGLVLCWIVNAFSPQIQSTLMHSQTAHQAWMDLEGRYNQKNAPKNYLTIVEDFSRTKAKV